MFLADRLTGEESVEILLHLEKCEVCYQILPERDSREVIERFLEDEEGEGAAPPRAAQEKTENRSG